MSALQWLGQAGFAVRTGDRLLFIDPYLSDHLARKYRGMARPHDRLFQPPVRAEEVTELDFVLCSHRHSDHMDPGTLPVLALHNPNCRFIVPHAEIATAMKIGLTVDRLIPVNAGETVRLSNDIELRVLPSAHEQLQVNERGEHHFLGFILRFEGRVIYHAGDCVPYDGLADRLRGERIGLALLPVNGRGKGVPGNFTFTEAVELCRAAVIPRMIPHHFGMFAFNTVDETELAREIASTTTPICKRPTLGHWRTIP